MDNYSKVKNLRNKNICLFEGICVECKSQGKYKTEKNHIIPRGSYLERICTKKKVMIFDFENRQYKMNGRKLVEKSIKEANTYRVLCGEHDKFLFDEIENGKKFDEFNKKQLFQFHLRTYLFNLSEQEIKNNFSDITSKTGNKIFDINILSDREKLEKYKNYVSNEDWEKIENVVIRLKRKIDFISCVRIQPFYDLGFPLKLVNGKVSINIFPEKDECIIILSYLMEDSTSKSIKKYCKKLQKCAMENEDKFICYMNKLIISFDHNIAICPNYWKTKNENEQNNFYKIAWMLPQCKTVCQSMLITFKLYFTKCELNLIPIK